MKSHSISPLAQTDMDALWFYIARDDRRAAGRLLAKFHEKFRLLAEQPSIGTECDEFLPGLRYFSVDNYVIYYRTFKEHVEIACVLHGAQDDEAIFGKPE